VDRDQQFLMPPDMAEWLPAGHLAWFVLEVVDELDTGVFHARHPRSGPGRSAYDPDMLLALLVYAYAVGQRSSRRIEALCATDVAFRVLCAQDPPDHSTIARFRAAHDEAFADLFEQVLVLCAQAGMGRLATVAIDGTKIAANASMDANRTEDWLGEEARRIVAEAAAVDAAEDEEFGRARGDELPEELTDPTTRRDRIRRALQQVQDKKRQAEEATERARVKAETYLAAVEAGRAPTGHPPAGVDPERLARARHERERRRLEQASSSRERNHARTGLRRAQRSLDKAQAEKAAERARAEASREQPTKPTTDDRTGRGGKTAKTGNQAKANTTDPDSRMMSTRRGWVQGYNAQIAVTDDHLILATTLTQHVGDVTCFEPMMHAAATAATIIDRHRPTTDTVGEDQVGIGTLLADAGYFSEDNLTVIGPDRLIALGTARELHRAARANRAAGPPSEDAPPAEQMRHRLRTIEGEQTYKRRGATVEPVIGHLKDQIGLRRFSRRGLKAAASELDLAAAVANLLKLHARTTAPAI
jgi:transposase